MEQSCKTPILRKALCRNGLLEEAALEEQIQDTSKEKSGIPWSYMPSTDNCSFGYGGSDYIG